MKPLYYLTLIVTMGIFATSCSNQYEKTISGFLQTSEASNVKIKEIKEIKKVTVGDSIAFLDKAAEFSIKNQIDAAEKQISKYQEQIVSEKNSNASKIIVEAYTKEIIKIQQAIDSLKSVKPAPVTTYDGKKTDEVIAVIVEGIYTITDQVTKTSTDATANFVLSPDGKNCYGTTQNPDMDATKSE